MSDWPFSRKPSFSALKSGTFSLTHNTTLDVTGWTTTYDSMGAWDNTNSRFVVPSTGLYYFQFCCEFSNTQVTGRRAMFIVNSVAQRMSASIGNAGTLVGDRSLYDRVPTLRWMVSALLYMDSTLVGDFVFPRALQNNGASAALNIEASAFTTFSGYKVS